MPHDKNYIDDERINLIKKSKVSNLYSNLHYKVYDNEL